MFKTKFNAGILFNKKAREGASDSELVWADVVEDGEEKDEDDIDTNKMAATADDDAT